MVPLEAAKPKRTPRGRGTAPGHWRRFASLARVLAACLLAPLVRAEPATADESPGRFLFVSRGRTGLASTDKGVIRYLDLQIPGQATWQPGPVFPDGRHVVLLSMEPRRDGPGKPFEKFYTQTPTHLWLHDLDTGTTKELCSASRPAPFLTPALLIGADRLLVQVVRESVGQILNVRLDGSDAREFTRAGEGLPYGLSLSPDGQRVAYHLASPHGYQVWTSDTEGKNRKMIAGHPEHLYFGTNWSPDGKWIVYVDCHFGKDPGHDWADVCIGRADGGEHRVLTTGQAMWFAATYGDPATRGGGSNVPEWTRDGQILFPRRLPDSKVAWEYAADRVDVDHFNRDFHPEKARGGCQICRLDPSNGRVTPLTSAQPGTWDFRSSESPDGRWVVFCRALVGKTPEIWVMPAHGGEARRMTNGIDHLGADHPRWLPSSR